MTVFYETPEERDERIRLAAEEARRKLSLTPGQAKRLARIQRKDRRRCWWCGR